MACQSAPVYFGAILDKDREILWTEDGLKWCFATDGSTLKAPRSKLSKEDDNRYHNGELYRNDVYRTGIKRCLTTQYELTSCQYEFLTYFLIICIFFGFIILDRLQFGLAAEKPSD